MFVDILSMVAFLLQWQCQVVATESVQPTKSEIDTAWSFTEKILPTHDLEAGKTSPFKAENQEAIKEKRSYLKIKFDVIYGQIYHIYIWYI